MCVSVPYETNNKQLSTSITPLLISASSYTSSTTPLPCTVLAHTDSISQRAAIFPPLSTSPLSLIKTQYFLHLPYPERRPTPFAQFLHRQARTIRQAAMQGYYQQPQIGGMGMGMDPRMQGQMGVGQQGYGQNMMGMQAMPGMQGIQGAMNPMMGGMGQGMGMGGMGGMGNAWRQLVREEEGSSGD